MFQEKHVRICKRIKIENIIKVFVPIPCMAALPCQIVSSDQFHTMSSHNFIYLVVMPATCDKYLSLIFVMYPKHSGMVNGGIGMGLGCLFENFSNFLLLIELN